MFRVVVGGSEESLISTIRTRTATRSALDIRGSDSTQDRYGVVKIKTVMLFIYSTTIRCNG